MNTQKPLIILLPGHDTRLVMSKKEKYHENRIIEITDPHTDTLLYDLPKWLLQDGFQVYLADYLNDGICTPSIEELSGWLSVELKKLLIAHPKRKVILIAYSLGGLVVRVYIDGSEYLKDKKKLGYEFVGDVFLIGIPNWGTGYHAHFNLMVDFKKSPQQAACRQFSDDTYMIEFNARYRHTNTHIPYYVIAGYGSQTLFGHLMTAFIWLTKGENNDGVATISNQLALKGAFQKAVVWASHVKDFGKTYFTETTAGGMSETYERYIRPVLLHEKTSWPLLQKTYTRTTPLWTFPLAVFGWIVFCVMYSIRFLVFRIKIT